MRRALVSIAIAFGATSACASEKPAESPAPGAAAPNEPARAGRVSELDALEHDLAIAEQRLNAQVDRKLALRESERASSVGGQQDAQVETEAPPPAERPSKKAEPAPSGETKTSARSWNDAELATPCDIACRALASMKRSADSICSLAGDADERCARARARVSSAEERVRRAGCACRER